MHCATQGTRVDQFFRPLNCVGKASLFACASAPLLKRCGRGGCSFKHFSSHIFSCLALCLYQAQQGLEPQYGCNNGALGKGGTSTAVGVEILTLRSPSH